MRSKQRGPGTARPNGISLPEEERSTAEWAGLLIALALAILCAHDWLTAFEMLAP